MKLKISLHNIKNLQRLYCCGRTVYDMSSAVCSVTSRGESRKQFCFCTNFSLRWSFALMWVNVLLQTITCEKTDNCLKNSRRVSGQQSIDTSENLFEVSCSVLHVRKKNFKFCLDLILTTLWSVSARLQGNMVYQKKPHTQWALQNNRISELSVQRRFYLQVSLPSWLGLMRIPNLVLLKFNAQK